MEFNPVSTWFHGSPLKLHILRMGSTITQKRDLARIFSHKPTIVSISNDGQVKHNGTARGYLYIVMGEIQVQDVAPHPQTTMAAEDEWLTPANYDCNYCIRLNQYPASSLLMMSFL